MPHTVQSTNAGAVSHSSRSSSTFGARRGGRNASPLLSVCPLPRSSAHLQLLRSRPDLLCRRLCRTGPARGATRGRTAVPNKPPRSRRPCVACPSLSGTAKECDASGFTAGSIGWSADRGPGSGRDGTIVEGQSEPATMALSSLRPSLSTACSPRLSAALPRPVERSRRTSP